MTVRFCVRCGRRVRRQRADGRWRRRCPACGWTFYGNPVPAAGAIIVRGSRVLLVLRARPPYMGTWDVPGGFLEADESAEEALRRELREELGARTRSLRFLGSAPERYGPRGFPVLALLYRVTVTGPLRAADDVAALRWFDRAEIPWRAIGFPNLRRFLRTYLGATSRV